MQAPANAKLVRVNMFCFIISTVVIAGCVYYIDKAVEEQA